MATVALETPRPLVAAPKPGCAHPPPIPAHTTIPHPCHSPRPTAHPTPTAPCCTCCSVPCAPPILPTHPALHRCPACSHHPRPCLPPRGAQGTRQPRWDGTDSSVQPCVGPFPPASGAAPWAQQFSGPFPTPPSPGFAVSPICSRHSGVPAGCPGGP